MTHEQIPSIEEMRHIVRSTEIDEFAAAMGHGRKRFRSQADYEYDRDIEDRARGERY